MSTSNPSYVIRTRHRYQSNQYHPPQSINDFGSARYERATTDDRVLQFNAEQYCAVLSGQFSTCETHFVPTDFYETCVDDILATDGVDALALGAASVDALSASCVVEADNDNVPFETPVSASRSNFTGLNNELSKARTYMFSVQARDVNGNVYSDVLTQDTFVATVTGPSPLPTITQHAPDLGKFTFGIITPNVLGSYVLSIKYRGVDHVANSPFPISTVVTSAPATTAYGDGLGTTLYAGTIYTVFIQAKSSTGTDRDSVDDVFTVAVSNGGVVTQAVTFTGTPGLYSFKYYQFTVNQQFTISITLGSGHISGSPFTRTAILEFK